MPIDKKLRVLEVIKKEMLPKGRKGRHATAACQVEDGTVFHRVRHPPDTLFVKCGEQKIVAQLPDDCIYNCGAYGNAIYKASFSTAEGITVTHLRNALENEEFLPGGLCARNEDDTVYVYRMGDDPDVDAIYVDTSSGDLYGARLVGVERRQCYPLNVVVFEIRNETLHKLSARRLNDSVILLEVPPTFSPPFARDSFVYITDGSKLLTLNTDSMEFLPPLQIGDSVKILNIVGVHNGEITVISEAGEEAQNLSSARLPDAYF